MAKSLIQKLRDAQRNYFYSKTPRRKYGQTKWQCKKTGTQFLLTLEEFTALCERPCYYCDQFLDGSGVGLDRVDNSIGYMITNVVPCCWACNSMKSSFPLEMFLNKVNAIYKNLVAKGLIQSDT